MRNGGRLTVDPSNVVGARLRIVRGASFDMSHQASCGEDVYVMAAVSCGAATMISGRVSFVGRDHPHKGVVGLMRDEPSLFPADIEIGSDCLIGFGATLRRTALGGRRSHRRCRRGGLPQCGAAGDCGRQSGGHEGASAAVISIVYPWFPHYRQEVFREISARHDTQFLLGHAPPPADQMHQGDRSTIPTRSGRSIWIGRLLVWQTGVVRSLSANREARTVIILGSVNYPFYWLLALYARFILRRRVLFWTIGWHAPEVGVKKYCVWCSTGLPTGSCSMASTARSTGSGSAIPPSACT